MHEEYVTRSQSQGSAARLLLRRGRKHREAERSARGAASGESASSSDGDAEHARVLVDGWLLLRMPRDALAPLLALRRRLAACFAAKARPVPDAALGMPVHR